MKQRITVITIGTGNPDLFTRQTEALLHKAAHLVLRTGQSRAAEYLEKTGIPFTTLDEFYGQYEDFDEMHRQMAVHLWEEAASRPVLFAVQDALTDKVVAMLRANQPPESELLVIPGVSTADVKLSAAAGSDDGWQLMPASSLLASPAALDRPLLITELDQQTIACNVKLLLLNRYDDEQPVLFFPSTAKRNRNPVVIPLWEVDQQPTYDHTVCVLIPAAASGRHPLRLLDLPGIAAQWSASHPAQTEALWQGFRQEVLKLSDRTPENVGRLLGLLARVAAQLCLSGESDEDELAALASDAINQVQS